jgi:hypothetical protein
VIRLENDDGGRRASVEAFPDLGGRFGRRKRIQNQCLAPGLNTRRSHDGLPSLSWLPVRMFEAPDPQARRYIAELDLRLRGRLHVTFLLTNFAT